MINKLREINKNLIKKYENVEDKAENLAKLRIIKELLKDDNCFLKISIDMAYNIFSDLEINEKNFRDLYLELTKKK